MVPGNRDELKIGELPRLCIMSIGDILFHEEPDIGRVARLIDRFSAEGILRNPLVVAIVDGTPRRVLLDGTNRATALKKLAVSDVLVQEIQLDDERLVVSQWHHAVERVTKDEILAHADRIPGMARQEEGGAETTDESNLLCKIIFSDGTGVVLFGSGDIFQKTDLLGKFTHLYYRTGDVDRVSYTDPAHLRKHYVNFSGLVSFREFSKSDIVQLADAGRLLPSGITRVLLPKRALNFNLHLDILKSRLSVHEKNEWLQETIRHRVLDKSIRFYREPTFSFDE